MTQHPRWSPLVFLVVSLLIRRTASFCPTSFRFVASLPHAPNVCCMTSATDAAAVTSDDSYHADLKKTLDKEPNFDDLNKQRRSKPRLIRGDVDGAEKAIRMLKHMVRIGVATEMSFQLVFESLLRRGRMQWIATSNGDFTCAANELEVLLLDLEDYYRDENLSVDTYNMVLEAYANCANSRGNYRYAERADQLLQNLGSDATATSLSHVVRAWSWQQGNRDDPKCARQAYDYLQQLEAQETTVDDDDEILAKAYDWVLEGFSKARGGASLAHDVFQKRDAISNSNNNSNNMPMADYTNMILAWTKDPKEESIEKATDLLETMTDLFLTGTLTEDPELIAYSSVISGWTNANQPERAEQLLWLMEKEVRPKAPSMQPGVYTYNNVCHGYIKDNSKITGKSLTSIANIVKYMEDHYKEQPLIKPDSYTYNTLIKAWTLSDHKLQTVEQMEQILDRMEGVLQDGKVTNKNFNVVLNAYAKSRDADAAVKALSLLNRMKASQLVDPDTITYTTVMACLSNCRDADFAVSNSLALLDEIQTLYKKTKKESLMPNSRTFSMAISTLTKSPDRIEDARRLLDQLIELYRTTHDPSLRPTVHAYNYVINCAANNGSDSPIRVAAFKIAARTYQEVREHKELKPDSYTYAFWFKACNQLLPGTSALYEKFMGLSFSQCRKEGMVSREVLNRLRQGHLTYPQLGEILKCDSRNVRELTIEDLDPTWARNVRL